MVYNGTLKFTLGKFSKVEKILLMIRSYLFRVRGFLPFYFLGGTAYFMINQMHNGRSDLFNAGLTGAVLGGITGVLAKGPKAIRPYAVLGILLSCTAYGIKIKQQSSSEGYRIPFEDRTEEENTFARSGDWLTF